MSMQILTAEGAARRKVIDETIADLKSGKMDVTRGMAIAANMKVINDSLFAEVAIAKAQFMLGKTGAPLLLGKPAGDGNGC